MAADRDITAQEAVHLLFADKFVGCTWMSVNLNANIDEPMLLRKQGELDDDDAVFETTFLQTMKDALMNKAF
jgi:hypothetical protein